MEGQQMVFLEENLKEDIWEAQVSANDSREVMSKRML